MSALPAAGARFAVGRTVLATPAGGSDLLAEIERLVADNGIDFCRFEGIGSLARACMTYYDQAAHADRDIEVGRPVMLVHLAGTALRSDAGVEVHGHLVLADALGMASGGDLSPGCIVFSCELVVQELVGPALERAADAATGLSHLGVVAARPA